VAPGDGGSLALLTWIACAWSARLDGRNEAKIRRPPNNVALKKRPAEVMAETPGQTGRGRADPAEIFDGDSGQTGARAAPHRVRAVSSSRDLLVRQIRGAARSNGTQVLRETIEAGLVVQDKAVTARDFFAGETSGYILFPNVVHGRVVDLQGRAYPTPARRSAYLNLPGPIRHLYNAGDAG
jgi:hypothetical protein